MIRVTVNNKAEFTIEGDTLNGEEIALDLLQVRDGSFHILHNHKSYNANLVSYNVEEKTMQVRVNGRDYEVSLKDQYDLLLHQLGISSKASTKVNQLKAPMPGLIISINAKEGDEIKKGDAIMILEAMKMENLLKSPRDGRVKKIHVSLRQAVEKNQVLVEFE